MSLGTLAAKVPLADAGRGYPNPVEQTFYLEGVAEGTAITITGVTGNKVRTLTLHNAAIDVRQLPAGLYLLNINDGTKAGHLKMLKQ